MLVGKKGWGEGREQQSAGMFTNTCPHPPWERFQRPQPGVRVKGFQVSLSLLFWLITSSPA